MKPLPSAPLTEEDAEVWSWVCASFGRHLCLPSFIADRQDAELMRIFGDWGPRWMRSYKNIYLAGVGLEPHWVMRVMGE